MNAKKLINLALVFAIGTLAFNHQQVFAGIDDSGGGDPLEISAIDYPDPNGLSAAIDAVQARVEATFLPDVTKDAIKSEMAALKAANKYLLLPSLIILSSGSAPEGYVPPKDIRRFLALGGMTATKRGSPIYFAERVLKYPTDKLAELVLHEILHHTVSGPLADNEAFIVNLAADTFGSAHDKFLLTALNAGVYPTKNFVSTRELLNFTAPYVCNGIIVANSSEFLNLERRIRSHYGDNISREYLADFSVSFSRNISDACNEITESPFDIQRAHVILALGDLSKLLNPGNTWRREDGNLQYCKKYVRKFDNLFVKSCAPDSYVTLQDILLPSS